jgi:hypothetical protein
MIIKKFMQDSDPDPVLEPKLPSKSDRIRSQKNHSGSITLLATTVVDPNPGAFC